MNDVSVIVFVLKKGKIVYAMSVTTFARNTFNFIFNVDIMFLIFFIVDVCLFDSVFIVVVCLFIIVCIFFICDFIASIFVDT